VRRSARRSASRSTGPGSSRIARRSSGWRQIVARITIVTSSTPRAAPPFAAPESSAAQQPPVERPGQLAAAGQPPRTEDQHDEEGRGEREVSGARRNRADGAAEAVDLPAVEEGVDYRDEVAADDCARNAAHAADHQHRDREDD